MIYKKEQQRIPSLVKKRGITSITVSFDTISVAFGLHYESFDSKQVD